MKLLHHASIEIIGTDTDSGQNQATCPRDSYIVIGPKPMQLVVPSAVRAAVAAAMKMRRITSHTEFFFIAILV